MKLDACSGRPGIDRSTWQVLPHLVLPHLGENFENLEIVESFLCPKCR